MEKYRKGVYDNMTENERKAENFLLRIRNTDKEMKQMFEQIQFLRYKASGMGAIRYDKDRVQTSPEDMVCECIAQAVQLENKLFARNRWFNDSLNWTNEILNLWNDDNNARFITIYYLNHGSMGDVAQQIGCSYRHTYRIKQEALKEFSKHL